MFPIKKQVIQPQITQTQLQQGITWAPQLFQNQFIIRGNQPDQQPMFIHQAQQPIHNSGGGHQQFAMRKYTIKIFN